MRNSIIAKRFTIANTIQKIIVLVFAPQMAQLFNLTFTGAELERSHEKDIDTFHHPTIPYFFG